MKLRIAEIRPLSPSIVKFTLQPEAGLLPVAGAGAHVVVDIPGPGRVWKNAYSLVTGPESRARYQIIDRKSVV